jgi:hypothetical protein
LLTSLGPFLCSSLYGTVSVACPFCSCPMLILPLPVCHCCHHFGHVAVVVHLRLRLRPCCLVVVVLLIHHDCPHCWSSLVLVP